MRILIVTGSSGGHIFPALSLISELKEKQKNSEILLVLPKQNILASDLLPGINVKFIEVKAINFKLNINNFKNIFLFIVSFFRAISVLIEFRPDVVVGFGSILSVPVIFTAWIFRIKTLIHEQNLLLGKANKFLSFFVDKCAISFIETKKCLKMKEEKIIFSGNPIRKSMARIPKEEARQHFGLEQNKFTILVSGGSQGSKHINQAFVEFISSASLKNDIQAIHLCGQNDFLKLSQTYEKLNVKVKVFDFLEAMQYAYSAADVIISRAGATTIAELVKFHLPAILVPYPYAYQHQKENALYLARKNSALVVDDKDLTCHYLEEQIGLFLSNSDKLDLMRQSFDNIPSPAAEKRLAEEVLKLSS